MAAATGLSGASRPTTTRCASGRSVRTLASASSSGTRPLNGTSALAVVMIRPGTRAISGRGRKWVWSTPIGHDLELVGAEPICSTMSRLDDADTVTIRGIWRATCICMPRNPYQRRSVSRRRQLSAWSRSRARSTVIGWWQVASSGHPSAITPSRPRPKHWLSWTTSNCPARAASARRTRQLNVRGSGNPAVHIRPNSATSIRVRNSRGIGHPERVRLPVQVEAGHRHEARPRRRGPARAGRRRR